MSGLNNKLIRPLAAFALVAVALLAGPQAAKASAEQRQALAELSKDVKKFLDGKGAESLVIGEFKGTGLDKTGAGSSFTIMLMEELAKLGVKVDERGKLGIEGTYSLAEVPASNPDDARIGKKVLAVKVKLEFFDDFDNRDKINFNRDIHLQGKAEQIARGPATLLKTFAPSTPLPPGNTEMENDKLLREHLVNKAGEPAPEGTLIRSAKGQPFAIEIVVNKKARAAEVKNGQAFVGIQRDETYAVRVLNSAPFEAAAQLSVDGLSMYAFSDLRQPDTLNGKPNPAKGEPLYSVMLVPAAKDGKPGEVLLEGWHRNNNPGGLDSFLVTEYAKSAPARLNRKEGVGTITVTFQAAWADRSQIPADEPGGKRGAGLGDATGFGPPTGGGLKEVSRELGVVRDCISVRYTK